MMTLSMSVTVKTSGKDMIYIVTYAAAPKNAFFASQKLALKPPKLWLATCL